MSARWGGEGPVLVAVLALLAGCGDAAPEGGPSPAGGEAAAVDAAALEGATYESTSVEGRRLVQGSTVRLGFEDGTLAVSAGCNTMFGPYAVTDGVLAWSGQPAATMMACSPELTEQDEWLTDLFTGGLQASRDGSTLTLRDDSVTITLAGTTPPPLDTLLGRTWTVVGTIADGRTTRLAVGSRSPWLTVGRDGLSRLFTGCNSGRTTVRVVDDQLGFGHATVSRGRCAGAARRTQEAVLAVVDDQVTDYVELDGNVLVVIVGGRGLVFEIE